MIPINIFSVAPVISILLLIEAENIIKFVVKENIRIGETVGVVDLRTQISSNDVTPQNTPIKESIISDQILTYTLQDNTYFNFDTKDPGHLIVQAHLDRDADRRLCNEIGWPVVCAWSGVLFVSDGRLYSLRVIVEDVNDNSPSWWPGEESNDQQLNASVTENCPLGTPIDLPMSTDPDLGENSIIRYEVKSAGKTNETIPFELINLTGQNGVAFRLVVKGHLDREQQAVYHLLLRAIDGGGLSGTANLIITVNDENDNPPIFAHHKTTNATDPFVIDIEEDLAVGSRVDRHPVATDADEGKFGQINYQFALSTSDTVKRDFRVEAHTGALVLRRPVDSDTGGVTKYMFTVVAEDQGTPALTASAKVVVNVLNCNDNAPQITITSTFLPEDYRQLDHIEGQYFHTAVDKLLPIEDKRKLRLLEEMPAGRLIATITVQDSDPGLDGQFTCKLIGGDRDTLQLTYLRQLGKLSVYHLTNLRPVDRESQTEIRATLSCQDHGLKTQQVSTEYLNITVLDVNDHSPRFSKGHYSFQDAYSRDLSKTLRTTHFHSTKSKLQKVSAKRRSKCRLSC